MIFLITNFTNFLILLIWSVLVFVGVNIRTLQISKIRKFVKFVAKILGVIRVIRVKIRAIRVRKNQFGLINILNRTHFDFFTEGGKKVFQYLFSVVRHNAFGMKLNAPNVVFFVT